MKKTLNLLLMLLPFVWSQALAQQYPAKPVTLIVPFSAGGPTDTTARLLAQSMGEALKTQSDRRKCSRCR